MSKFGLVLIHGFTSDQRSMQGVVEIAESLGYAVETPLLRGHGRTYRDLRGTSWDDWMADVGDALARLRTHTSHIVIVGFSMGGLLALATAAHHTDIEGIVALAPALRIAHPMAPFAFLGRGWLRYVPMGKAVAYSDPIMAREDDSYARLALDAFVSFYRATRRVERLLPRIKAPLLVMHALRDRVIRPEAAMIAYTQVESTDKELVWLEHSGHSLLADVETERVLEHVRGFLSTISNKQRTTGDGAGRDVGAGKR